MDVDEFLIMLIRRFDQHLPVGNDDIRQNALNEAAHVIRRLRDENDRQGDLLRTAKSDWGVLHDREVARIEYREHLKYRHVAKSTYEENMQRPTARGDATKGTG